MNGYRPSRRFIQLFQLLTIASTTSAVSLQDFQTITIIQVPSLSCLAAYGSTIRGCSRSDFKDGVQCSDSCAEGVQQEQVNVIAACKHIEVNDGSLLGLTLQGGLLDALCPNFQVTSVTSTTVKPSTTRTFLTPSQTPETSTSITSTAESSSTMTTSISSSSIESSTTVTTSTTSSVESSATITSTSSEVDATGGVTLTETGGVTTTSSTSTPSPTQTGNEDRGSSGGGSPFDTVFTGGAKTILQFRTGMLTALTGTLVIAFLI